MQYFFFPETSLGVANFTVKTSKIMGGGTKSFISYAYECVIRLNWCIIVNHKIFTGAAPPT